MRKKKTKPVLLQPLTLFNQSLKSDVDSAVLYQTRLIEYGISCIEWVGLPPEIDQRFLEYTLLTQGQALFFRDDELGQYLALPATGNGRLNFYNIPIDRQAYASNGYKRFLTENESVFIFNNYTHSNMLNGILWYASQLSEIDVMIKINTKAQKTPLIISCEEEQRLTMENLYKEYDGNSAIIMTNSKIMPEKNVTAFDTKAEFKGDKLYALKQNIWHEALTYLGIENVSIEKSERLIKDEVNRAQGAVYGERIARIGMREQACRKINEMFGLNVSVKFRDGLMEESIRSMDNDE